LVALRERGKHTFTANRAHSAGNRMDFCETIRAYRQARDIQQRQTAEPAVGWKENREEALGGAARPPSSVVRRRASRNNRRRDYCDGAPVNPDSVLTTAEDCLLSCPAGTTRPRPFFSGTPPV